MLLLLVPPSVRDIILFLNKAVRRPPALLLAAALLKLSTCKGQIQQHKVCVLHLLEAPHV